MKNLLITFFTVLFCLTSSVGWSLEYKDLVYLDGLYYKKFTEVPFTGKVKGKTQGSMKNGKKDGSWIGYFDNGQLHYKGEYKNGKREGSWLSYWANGKLKSKGNYKNDNLEGSWIYYNEDGTIWEDATRTYKNGKMISE